MAESFILLNLKEEKAKEVANILTNETCKKILEYMAGKEFATETEISKELKIPLSTVHYNVTQLLNSGLIKVEEFHYSERGREVDHYKLANKFVIIAPPSSKLNELKERLRTILPLALIAVASSAIVYWFKGVSYMTKASTTQPLVERMDLSAPLSTSYHEPNIALWFLLGAFTIIISYALILLLKKKK